MNRRYFIFGYVVGVLFPFVLVVVAAMIRFNNDSDIVILPKGTPHLVPRVNLKALDLVDLEGNKVNLAAYPDSVMIVDFWATWCSPCVAGFPQLDSIRQAKNIRVVTISDQKIENIKRFKEKYPYGFTYLKLQDGFKRYGITALPLTLKIKKDADSLRIVAPLHADGLFVPSTSPM